MTQRKSQPKTYFEMIDCLHSASLNAFTVMTSHGMLCLCTCLEVEVTVQESEEYIRYFNPLAAANFSS